MARNYKHLGEISTPPLPNHHQLTASKLFKSLCEAGAWNYEQVAEKLDISAETVKAWGSRNVIPNEKSRAALFSLIYDHTVTDDLRDSWKRAFEQAWMRNRIIEKIGNQVCQNVLNDPNLLRLPALFETDQSLPIATAYVELQLTPYTAIEANPALLESSLTLRQRINKKIEARYVTRRTPQEQMDSASQTTLILGAPGAGKSSLLRRITLDIAEGKWKTCQVPLFVEARAYWMARKSGAPYDLLTYAINRYLPLEHSVEEAKKLLLQYKKEQQILLLVDGLDEISGDPDAVNLIYDELKLLARSIPWIASSRPAGVMGSLGNVQRCEIVDLDEDSIEALIDNWCQSVGGTLKQIDPTHLKTEILGSSGTREMAKNPFLLTALCFLKSIRPELDLPLSRIEVYEILLERIADQAQKRHGNKNILDPRTLQALQDFSFDLYDRPDGVLQIFNRTNWWEFSKKHKYAKVEDFDSYILPARMLTSWEGTDTQFHFLHLSLQEHLIARAMLQNSVESALERRFHPNWRVVFRFYGALLLQQERHEEFQELTTRLYQEEDINNLSFVTLAYIFADAGIKDTTSWIEEDLREKLYYQAISRFDAVPDAMIDAIALLDPHWLEKTVTSELNEIVTEFEAHTDENEYEYSDQGFIINGRSLDSPYEKLARIRTGNAKRIIANTFWGNNHKRALMAAYAFASIATPSERRAILNKSMEISMSDEMAMRVFAFAQAVHRAEFVPFLGRFLLFYADKAKEPFSDILNLLADIGGKEAALIFEELSTKEALRCYRDEFNAFEATLKAIVRMGGNEAVAILDKLSNMPETILWAESIKTLRIQADASDEVALITELSNNSSLVDETIAAIAGAATFGRLPSDNVVQVISKIVNVESVYGIEDLAFIEASRLDAGEAPILCDLLLEIANKLYKKIHDSDDANDLDTLKTALILIFDTLSQGQWKPARKLIQDIFKNRKANDEIMESAIALSGYIYARTTDTTILRTLKEFIFQEDNKYAQVAAFATGRIDLEELFRLQSTEMATEALEEIAADEDLLIFDDFWVDKFGNQTKWINPPKKICYIYEDDAPELPEIFAHEMSRYGFCYEADDPESCVAFLIFSTKEKYAEDLAEQARRIHQYTGSNNPLFEIPENLCEEEAKTMANSIGIELLSVVGRT